MLLNGLLGLPCYVPRQAAADLLVRRKKYGEPRSVVMVPTDKDGTDRWTHR